MTHPTTRLLALPPKLATRRPSTQPLYQASVFHMDSYQDALDCEQAFHPESYYGRWGNPTVAYLEEQISVLTDCESSLVFPSGMAAITCLGRTFTAPGQRVLISKFLYGDTTRFFTEELGRWGVVTDFFDPTCPNDGQELKALLSKKETPPAFVYYESLSNPDLRVAHFTLLQEICHQAGVWRFCDATFTPPGVLRPGLCPGDVVIHSLTKYFSGHESVFGGSLSGPKDLVERLWHAQSLTGGILDPHPAFTLIQGVKTLALRVKQQSENALALAHFLKTHGRVQEVFYPNEHFSAQAGYFEQGGGVVSFILADASREATVHFLEALRLIPLSVSLGGPRTRIEHAAPMSHSMISPSVDGHDKAPHPGLIRLAVGLEDIKDLKDDLTQALN